MSPELLEVAVTESVWVSLAAPEEIPERLTVWAPLFSLMLRLDSVSYVGAWLIEFSALALHGALLFLLAPPSLTVTVIADEPFPLATGVKLRDPVALGLV